MNKKILGIGNAIVDVLTKVDDDFLKKNNLIKGSMKLIDKIEFENLKKKIKIETGYGLEGALPDITCNSII